MENKYRRGIILFLFMLSFSAIAKDENFRGIEALMTDQEFHEAGLDKLSVAEREALNQWLAKYTGQEIQQIKDEIETGKYEATSFISSQIAGEFTGWDGKTVFVLKNGQIWKQRLPARWKTSMVDPEVEIRTNFLGFYYMEVVGTGKRVSVTRLPNQ